MQPGTALEGLVTKPIADIGVQAYIAHQLRAGAQSDAYADAVARRDAEELVDITHLKPSSGRNVTRQNGVGQEVRDADKG